MNSPTLTQDAEAAPQEISFGGVVWKKEERDSGLVYNSQSEDSKEFRISQYEDGRWHWMCDLHKDFNGLEFQTLENYVSGIVNHRDEAMLCCLNAKQILIADIALMMTRLIPDSQYAEGFRAGQEDIKAKIAEVVL